MKRWQDITKEENDCDILSSALPENRCSYTELLR